MSKGPLDDPGKTPGRQEMREDPAGNHAGSVKAGPA